MLVLHILHLEGERAIQQMILPVVSITRKGKCWMSGEHRAEGPNLGKVEMGEVSAKV